MNSLRHLFSEFVIPLLAYILLACHAGGEFAGWLVKTA
jgi:hypothetical protein